MGSMTSSVSPKGQITIPAGIRRLLGVRPKDRVAFRVEDGRVEIVAERSLLDSLCGFFPALRQPLSDEEMVQIAVEEHAAHVAEEGRQR